jgi:hypothetical protein
MNSVFYLCRSPNDPKSFLFANELPDNYYAPGLFIVEADNRSGVLDERFKFLARQGLQTLNLELQGAERGRSYVVDAGENGKFYFKVIALDRTSRYFGHRSNVFRDMPLYRLEPANMRQLELACVERGFYFIGSAGSDGDNA